MIWEAKYLTLHILSANNNDRAESDSSNETLNQIQIDTNESFMEMKREKKIMSSAQNWFSTVASRARVDDYFNHHYVRWNHFKWLWF